MRGGARVLEEWFARDRGGDVSPEKGEDGEGEGPRVSVRVRAEGGGPPARGSTSADAGHTGRLDGGGAGSSGDRDGAQAGAGTASLSSGRPTEGAGRLRCPAHGRSPVNAGGWAGTENPGLGAGHAQSAIWQPQTPQDPLPLGAEATLCLRTNRGSREAAPFLKDAGTSCPHPPRTKRVGTTNRVPRPASGRRGE